MVADLHHQGVIRDPIYFLIIAKFKGPVAIRAGEYHIPAHATPKIVLATLARGKVVLHKLTIVEGWTFARMMAVLNANPYVRHTVQGYTPEMVMASIGHPGENPEGRFYPDTYLFIINTSDSVLLRMAYNAMEKKYHAAWKTRDQRTPYTDPYQALIVASMVEKETAYAPERPLVAGVILKRLQLGMRLQIDATVIYGAGGNYRGSITRANLATDSPYNTYTRPGLPPTPICMPSITSLHAALHPQITDALYYVAKGNGSHIFSTNFAAHRNAVQQYLIPHVAALNALNRCSFSAALMLDYWLSLGDNNTLTICSIPSEWP